MRTFLQWLTEGTESDHERLEAAVRDYMRSRPEAKKCYYITAPRNRFFDPTNPKHVEEELGPDYDKSIEVAFRGHPHEYTCGGVSHGLAEYLRGRGFKARVASGWYGNAEGGYSAGYGANLDDQNPSPPRGFGTNAQMHWWVEVGNYIIDLTSAQFHPRNPSEQKDLVIRDRAEAMSDGSYMAYGRSPLGRAVRLPENVMRMINKIVSLKKFASKHSSVYGDNIELADWILKNSGKFSVPMAVAQDAVAALRGSTRPGFYFSDKRMLERTFGEAFDDVDEDVDMKKQDDVKARL